MQEPGSLYRVHGAESARTASLPSILRQSKPLVERVVVELIGPYRFFWRRIDERSIGIALRTGRRSASHALFVLAVGIYAP